MKLDGKLVVLTGASGGIGSAAARALALAGARLVLVSRNQARLGELASGLAGAGHRAVAADLTSDLGRQQVVAACDGHLDVLINNAGINQFGLIESQSEEQLRQMLEINVLAPMLLTRALLPLLRQGQSLIVNVGSGFGSIGFPGYCGYSASKFALRGFTEALRRELADSPVSVRYLAPRATATDMNTQSVVKMNRDLGNTMDTPKTVAAELLACVAKNADCRYIGWPERFFVKMNALFPAVVDKALAKQLPIVRRYAVARGDESS